MEKWKIAVITLLIAGFGFLQFIQQKPPNPQPNPDPGQPQATATPDPKLAALIGTKPVPWDIAPNLWMNTPRPIKPADLKGKVAVLEFWRTQCHYCEEAVPDLVTMQSTLAPRGLKIVTFQSPGDLTDPQNPELDWKAVKTWAKTRKVNYPVAFDTARKVRNQYGIEFYPLTLVVDRNGLITYAQTGHSAAKSQELQQAVAKAMS